MADRRAIEGLLEYEYSNKSKEMIKKALAIGVPTLMGISLIISLSIVVSLVHEKQNSHPLDCILKPTFQNDIYKTCPYVDQYPLTNEVYVRICVNETIQIDIRRFYDGNPKKMKEGYDIVDSWGSEEYLLKRKTMPKKYCP
uniref:Uncharacterized protein n=1 Tax=Magallana gigas TaxID=29159 RepID=A0A8W8JKM2_MAGGI